LGRKPTAHPTDCCAQIAVRAGGKLEKKNLADRCGALKDPSHQKSQGRGVGKTSKKQERCKKSIPKEGNKSNLNPSQLHQEKIKKSVFK